VAAAKMAVERSGHVVVEMGTWTAADAPPSVESADRVRGYGVRQAAGVRYGTR
jgi:hypothetical protein